MSACGAVYCDFAHLAAFDMYGFFMAERPPVPSVVKTSRTISARFLVHGEPGAAHDAAGGELLSLSRACATGVGLSLNARVSLSISAPANVAQTLSRLGP